VTKTGNTFVIVTAGTYRVGFVGVTTTTSLLGSVNLEVNGVSQGTVPIGIAGSPINYERLLTLAPADVVRWTGAGLLLTFAIEDSIQAAIHRIA